jgi:hypothetical protein
MTAAIAIEIECEIEEELRDLYAGVTVQIMRITPVVARQMLERNKKNRPLNQHHVKNMKDMFLAGDMILNGEAIIFDAEDNLLNGQHRLHGCVESGVAWDAIVVRGIDPDAFRTLDGGKKRTTADSLAMCGEAHATQLSAAAQALLSFVDFGGVLRHTTSGSRKATAPAVQRVLEAHPELRRSVQVMSRTRLYNNQYGYVLHYLFSRVNAKLADEFAEVLASGHTDIGRPFVRLRETLIEHGPRTDMRRKNAAKAIKAFNAELNGDRPKMFKFSEIEDFPEIDGLDYEAIAESV